MSRYLVDHANPFRHANGAVAYYSPFPFRSLALWRDCPCPDGRRRTVYATSEPDTFFSVPARVAGRVRGVTVSGFVSRDETGPRFNPTGRNKMAAYRPEALAFLDGCARGYRPTSVVAQRGGRTLAAAVARMRVLVIRRDDATAAALRRALRRRFGLGRIEAGDTVDAWARDRAEGGDDAV
jgi:hypothetical protein